MDKNDKYNISGAQFTQPAEEFQVRSATSAIVFDFMDAQPPMGTYIGVDDALQIVAFSNASLNTVTVNVRVLALDGLVHPFQFQIQPSGARTAGYFRFQLMEGYLLSCTANWSGQPNASNWAFIQINLTRAPFGLNNQYDVLLSGYLAQNTPLAYPEAILMRATDGAGVVRSITGTVPGPGADISETVPTSARWRVISFRAQLTTSVAVANRDVSLTYDDGANIFMESPSNLVLAASLTNIYNYFDSATLLGTQFNSRTVAPIPSQGLLVTGNRIRTNTTGINAADQWSAPQYQVVEWLDNA